MVKEAEARRITSDEFADYKQHVQALRETLRGLAEKEKRFKISPLDSYASLVRQGVLETVGKIEPGVVFAPWSIPWTVTAAEDGESVQKEALEEVLALGIDHRGPEGYRAFLTSDGRLLIPENVSMATEGDPAEGNVVSKREFRVGTNSDWIALAGRFPEAILEQIKLCEAQKGRIRNLTSKGNYSIETEGDDTADAPAVNAEITQNQEAQTGEASTETAQTEEKTDGVKGYIILSELVKSYGDDDGRLEIGLETGLTASLEKNHGSIRGQVLYPNQQDYFYTTFVVGPEGLKHLNFHHQMVEEPFFKIQLPGSGVCDLPMIESLTERGKFQGKALVIAQGIQAILDSPFRKTTS